MAISDASKVDLLWKKVAFGVTKSDSSAAKSGSNETISSPLPVYANQIWAQAGEIPAQPPEGTHPIVTKTSVKATMDTTSTKDLTWISGSTDWIPATFNANYSVKVYVGDPAAGGTQIFPDTNNEEYVFDYQAGVLTFLNSIPSGVATKGIYLVGFRYVGTKGITGAGAGARNHVVANIAERNAITKINAGDSVMVLDASGIATDAGPGEYAVYMYDGSGFRLVATQDSSSSDSKTRSVVVDSNTLAGDIALWRVGDNTRIISCSIDVVEEFPAEFDISVILDGDTDVVVMGSTDSDLMEVGTYVVTPMAVMSATQETPVVVRVPSKPVSGKAIVTITYA